MMTILNVRRDPAEEKRGRRLRIFIVALAVAAVAATGAYGVTSSDTITTVAGTGVAGFSGDGGPATSAKVDLSGGGGVAVDGKGNVYIADMRNGRVRKVGTDGLIATLAGTGGAGYSGDSGLATSAQLYAPEGVAVDGQGNVFIADRNNFRVRKVSSGGTITTVAGGGKPGVLGDGGPATSATFRYPASVALDRQGNLYIADRDNMRVRKVTVGGTITTIAGTGVQGFSGDGGPGTAAQLRFPQAVAVDGQGNVYIADNGNNRVRRVTPSGTISTFAGTGQAANDGDGDGGLATSANLQLPRGVAADGEGNVYITAGYSVRKVSTNGKISTVAGGGRVSPGDGGPATSANIGPVAGVAVDGKGDLYFAAGHRIRKVTMGTQNAAVNLTLGGAAAQPLLAQKSIVVTVKADTRCSLSATGVVTILGTKLVFVLTRATATFGSGTRKLTLRLSAAEQRRLRKAFKSGQKARAIITVRATSNAGGTGTAKRIVAVQR